MGGPTTKQIETSRLSQKNDACAVLWGDVLIGRIKNLSYSLKI